MKTLYACPAAYEGDVVIPDTVTTIARRAFSGCKMVKEIVLPASVATIEEQAFADCKALKKLVLPDKIGNSRLYPVDADTLCKFFKGGL